MRMITLITTFLVINFFLWFKGLDHSQKNSMKKLYIRKVHEKWSIFYFYGNLGIVVVFEIIAFEIGDFEVCVLQRKHEKELHG
jgi:hypothetical protein